jgi:hypothetical protein
MFSLEDFHTVGEYFRGEGRMIKRLWRTARGALIGAIVTIAVVVGLVEWEIIERHFEGATEDLKAANTKLDATIKYQSEQLADYRNKLQVSTPDEAAKKLKDFEDRLKPILDDLNRPQRALTEDQKKKLAEYAGLVKAQLADFWVFTSASEDTESEMYAIDISKALKGAGIRSMFLGVWLSDKTTKGIVLEMLDVDHPSEQARMVMDILAKAGISYEKRLHENDYPNQPELELFITRP